MKNYFIYKRFKGLKLKIIPFILSILGVFIFETPLELLNIDTILQDSGF